MLTLDNIGIAAPIMYYLKDPKRIWCAGVKRNMTTSKTIFIGNGQYDRGQFNKLFESDDFPNTFIVRREIMENEGILFDERIFPWMYEESDFCYRVRKKGWKVVLVPSAKVWHDVPLGINVFRDSEIKVYLLGRNRILFHRKYGTYIDFIIFVIVFLPVVTLVYSLLYMWKGIFERDFRRSIRLSAFYIKGVIDGIKYIFRKNCFRG